MDLLLQEQRFRGLSVKTPLSVLPDDITPEWSAVREALDTAFTALIEYDGANDDYLNEGWQRIAEGKERAYVAAVQNGGPLPKRPKGGYVSDAEDKCPAIVGEWFRLARVKDAADAAAWKVFVAVAPLAIPDAHDAIGAAGEVYKVAEAALEKARDAFVHAFSYRRDLEQFARGTDSFTGMPGLPLGVSESVTGERLPASMVVPRAIEWLDTAYGPADTSGRLPSMRRVRGANGIELDMPPHLALMMENNSNGNTIKYVDGLPPESKIGRKRAARLEVTENADVQ
jgi:hypothetical protein